MSASPYDYSLQCAALQSQLAGQDILVTEWRGSEGVSQLYRYEITVAVRSAGIDLNALLDQPATLRMRHPDGSVLRTHGIITEGAQNGHDQGYDYYRFTLEPRLARLALQQWSDVYLDKPLDDLIIGLLKEARLTDPYSSVDNPFDYRILIPSQDLVPMSRPFVCQFEESCLDFLMRKLEFYGVYFWFEQGDEREAVVFGNEVSQQPAEADEGIYYPKGLLEPDVRHLVLTRLDRRAALQPGRVALRALHGYDNTTVDLLAQADVPDARDERGFMHSAGDHFAVLDGTGSSRDGVPGATLAKWRAQEIACSTLQLRGVAETPGVRAGRYLKVSEFQLLGSSAQYYVLRVEHQGVQTVETSPLGDEPAYRAHFVALPRWRKPADKDDPVQFRPPRLTPVPRVLRLMTGFIEYTDRKNPQRFAQPDDYGRYKVRLPFVRRHDEGYKNSAWLRQSTPYAAGASQKELKKAGMHFPLREGTEVLIAFLNGDPDLPVIVGSLPNVEAPSVVASENSRAHVLRTPGGNEFSIVDGIVTGSGDVQAQVEDDTQISLYTPMADTSLVLGAIPPEAGTQKEGESPPASAKGFKLHTAISGDIFAGEALVMEVPGHYRLAAGGTEQDVLTNFLGSEATLAPGVKASQSGGVVFENFMGAKFSSAQSIVTEFTLGAASSTFVGFKFDSLFAGCLNIEWAFKKDINLREKTYTLKNGNWVAMSLRQQVFTSEGVAGDKSQQALDYRIKTFRSYSVTGPNIKLSTPSDFAVLSLLFGNASLTSEMTTTVKGSIAKVSGTASTTVEAAGGVTQVTLDANGFSGKYPIMRSRALGMASMQAAVVQLG